MFRMWSVSRTQCWVLTLARHSKFSSGHPRGVASVVGLVFPCLELDGCGWVDVSLVQKVYRYAQGVSRASFVNLFEFGCRV